VTAPTRDAFGEQRRAVALLGAFPGERVWGDRDVHYRHFCLALHMQRPELARLLESEDPEARRAEFARIDEGIVVTGGGRLPWYGCYRCTANLGSLDVPPTWSEVASIPGSLTRYRQEPLRIWRVSKAAGLAEGMVLHRRSRREPARPAAARDAFAEVADRHRDTPWAPLARQQLDVLDRRTRPDS
jgi:hypothetical protein